MSNPIRWKSVCKAEKLLKELFLSGGLKSNCSPKPTWDSSEEFKNYKLDTFRTHLNKVKCKFGTTFKQYLESILNPWY